MISTTLMLSTPKLEVSFRRDGQNGLGDEIGEEDLGAILFAGNNGTNNLS